ncbi:hypothetical protein [Simplicispira psychrophila]|uniref:hypothetical protein n=1 Tax=Simplicispira psychrophila TaxID=80882 RepID=UPI001B80C392|nr:hypothetical protein [Simplicispira psychrophila]
MKRHVLTALALINVALIAVLAALWFNSNGSLRNVHWIAPAAIKNDYLQMLPALPERKPVDTNRFLALLERPLFQPTRRPPPPPPPPSAVVEAPVDTLSTAQLSGVVTGEHTASIIITVAGKARRLRLNESLDGWTLQSIQGRSVTFAGGGQTRVLQLTRAAVATFSGAALTMPAPPAPSAKVASPASAPPAQAAVLTAPDAALAAPKPPRRPRFGP